jgi:hypothetical protein
MDRFLDEIRWMLKDPWFWVTLLSACAVVMAVVLIRLEARAAPVKVEALESLKKRQRYCDGLAALAFEAYMDFRRNPDLIISAADADDQAVIDLAHGWKGTAIELQQKVMAECRMVKT